MADYVKICISKISPYRLNDEVKKSNFILFAMSRLQCTTGCKLWLVYEKQRFLGLRPLAFFCYFSKTADDPGALDICVAPHCFGAFTIEFQSCLSGRSR